MCVPPPVLAGPGLSYFGVHVLGELQYSVHSRPGIRMLFQVCQHLLCHSLLCNARMIGIRLEDMHKNYTPLTDLQIKQQMYFEKHL